MELRHLRYFVAVAEEGAMARAAERLHLTQPSLSRQIRQLERDMGTPLFERTTRGTTLTAAGTALHRHALLLLRLADATKDVARAPDTARDMVNLGVPQGVPPDQLMRVLAEVEERLPHTAISITEASSAEQLKLIREGHLDLGIVRERPSGNLLAERLFDVPTGLAVRPGHHLAEKPVCRLSDLDGLRVLAHGRQQVPVLHDRLVVAAHDAGLVPLWHFAQFSEHALVCAQATKAEAVLLIEHSARRLLPDWPWLRLAEADLALTTWLAWPSDTRSVVRRVARVVSGCLVGASSPDEKPSVLPS
ncbi:LysR family transcriptional regulator [Streptomyces blattellae]|uniref:LysR family transcriptional regulator n=1 Tax=Streptomyces blattellae TaxID=2569855 RepID=UPI0012B7752F|nr:LysR family transcriptional regulator [Streptomyces blattellae]